MGKDKSKGKKKSKRKEQVSVADLLPTFKANRGPITYPLSPDFNLREEVNSMNISVSRVANAFALLAFAAAAFSNTVLGLNGLELVAAGLGLHAGADLLEDVLS